MLELRQKFHVEAYTFRRTYDYSKPVEGLGYNRYGGKITHIFCGWQRRLGGAGGVY